MSIAQVTKMVCIKLILIQTIFYVIHNLRVDLEKTARRSPKGQVSLVLLRRFAECGNRKALRLKAKGVYSCK